MSDIEQSRTFTRKLPVDLTDDEVRKKGKKAGELQAKIDETRQKMNDAIAGHRKDLKELNAKLHIELSDLERGKEDRDVPCIEQRDFSKKKAITIRTDTQAEVESRILSADELQRELPRVTDPEPEKEGGEKPKRGRGRPKKNPEVTAAPATGDASPKRGRGRPKKPTVLMENGFSHTEKPPELRAINHPGRPRKAAQA